MILTKPSAFILKYNISSGTLMGVILISVLISVALLNYLVVGIAVVMITLLILLYGERLLLAVMIVSLFTLVGDLGPGLRLAVQLINFSLLAFLFLYKYGFDFKNYPKIPRSLIYFLLLYYFAMIITTLFSDHILIGFNRIARQSVFFVVAYIFFSFLKDFRYVKTYILALIAVSLLLALSSIYQFSAGGFKLLDFALGVRYRVSGLISNVDTTTAFFILTFPIIITLSVSRLYRKWQPLLFLLIITLTIGTILTTSRSAIMAIVASLLFILFYLRKDIFKKLIYLLIVVIILFILVPPLNQWITFMLRIQEGLTNRDVLWTLAFNVFKDNPVLGIGPGSYKYEMFNYIPVMLNTWIGNLLSDLYIATGGRNNAHSLFLTFASDMGIPGIVALFYFVLIYFRIAARTIRKAKDGNQTLFFIILAISVAAGSMFIRAIFDSIGILTYGFLTNDLPFWLWFSILIFFYQKPQEYFKNKSNENLIPLSTNN